MKRTFILSSILGIAVALAGGTGPARAQPAGNTVTYPAGTSLVAGPPGTDFSGGDGALSTLQSSDRDYESVQPSAGTQTGYGYWAQFDQPTSVQLNQGSNMPFTASALAGQWILIGDPSGTLPATVTGAGAVYTYDPTSGYQAASLLQPGQGAWALGTGGGAITITPQTQAALAAAASLRTFQGTGYQVGVPNDWDRVSTGQGATSLGGVWVSSGGQANLQAYPPAAAPAGVPLNAVRIMTADLSDPKFLGSEQVAEPPVALTVQGADGAAIAVLTGTDRHQVPFRDTIVFALKSQVLYEIELYATPDYTTQNQTLIQQILQSFQVTP